MAEVDRFAHLGIGLIDGLAGLRSGDLDELAPARGENIADTMQCGCTLLGGQGLPGVRRLGARLDESVDRLVVGQSVRSRTHGLNAPRRGRDCRSNLTGPLPIGGKGGIRIRLGGEGTTRTIGEAPLLSRHPGLALSQTILDAVGNGQRRVRINVGQSSKETVALAGEDVLVRGDVKHAGHEVFGRSVLFQAAHQVRDGDVEFSGVHDRDIQEEGADITTHDLLNAGGHAREHLELDAVLDPSRGAQLVGEGNIKDVLSGHSQTNRAGALGRHRPTQHPLVVGVGGLLGRPGRQLPAVDLGVHLLHGQIRTLHDADLDARTSRVHACARPLLETLEGTERIGQVCLEDDAGLVTAHIRLIEDRGEHRDRQVEVLVILHVEVQERPVVTSEAVEGQEGAHAVVDDLLEAPRVVGACHRGDLDRHVVNVLTGHEARDLSQAVRCFLLTENRLTEEVHVQTVAALAQALKRGAEALVGRVDDEVADDLAEYAPGHRCHRTRRKKRRGRAEAHRRGQGRGQEVLAAGRQALHGCAGHVQVSGAHHVINESGRESKSIRIGEDTGQELGRARRGLTRRFVGPAAGTDDRPLPQGPKVIGTASSVDVVVGWCGNSGVRHA